MAILEDFFIEAESGKYTMNREEMIEYMRDRLKKSEELIGQYISDHNNKRLDVDKTKQIFIEFMRR